MVQILKEDVAALNAICPYFTMFPLEFPHKILKRQAVKGQCVVDPFCGRGTTLFAARLLGLQSVGIDSNRVAVAITDAKLTSSTPIKILNAAKSILDSVRSAQELPQGEFWRWAFHRNVLSIICRLREGLMYDCRSNARKALRGIILGALHGPLQKTKRSYFSNQCPRTYAPKPRYSIKFWKSRGLKPQEVDVLGIIEERAIRYYANKQAQIESFVIEGDSRNGRIFDRIKPSIAADWIITSPPYYGLRTYIPDQWLRYWFLGGEPQVQYHLSGQFDHSSRSDFEEGLRLVWRNVRAISTDNARLVVRFGAINNRKVDPVKVIKNSLHKSGWEYMQSKSAGTASKGRRQALHFSTMPSNALVEYDIWAKAIK